MTEFMGKIRFIHAIMKQNQNYLTRNLNGLVQI